MRKISKTELILFSHKCGQLGNRLFTFAHLIANAAANNLKVSNLSFDEYARYFATTSQDIFCRYPPAKTFLNSNRLRTAFLFVTRGILKLLRKLNFLSSALHGVVIADMPEFDFSQKRYFQLNDEDFQKIVNQKPLVFLFGRFFRDYLNFEKHQTTIREFFRPTADIQRDVDNFVMEARKNVDLLIGVHIRRGDYAEFAGGKYFYSQEEYCVMMRSLQNNIPSKKIRFVVCSNERTAETIFEGVDFLTGPGHIVGDMYILSSCDLIVGPPSTYSTWASFYGNKPMYQLTNLKHLPTFDDFAILPSHLLYNF